MSDWLGYESIQAALSNAQAAVRKEPARAQHRVYLFQLLVLTGQWERALNQLNVLADLDASTLPMVHTYRQAIQTEGLRQAVFKGERMPLIFGEPAHWIALLLEALRLTAQGHYDEAKRVRSEAFDLATATSGRVEQPIPSVFTWIADADERLGPMLEAIVDGKYYWVPFNCVRRLLIEPPQDLRDLVWMPVHFGWSNGGESVGLMPSRYPASEASDDDRIVRASLTRWVALADGLYVGEGQRLLVTDTAEYPLMDLREIIFDTRPGLKDTEEIRA